jgi:hypothetical protein
MIENEKFPCEVLESFIVFDSHNYEKLEQTLRSFAITIWGVENCNVASVAFLDFYSMHINKLGAEVYAAAQYIEIGFIKVSGRLGPWYWVIANGEVEIAHGYNPIPPD